MKSPQVITARAWEQVQREFVEMPPWIKTAFARAVAEQVGIATDTVTKYVTVSRLGENVDADKLGQINLTELRMTASIKEPTLQRKFVNTITKLGLKGKEARAKMKEFREKDVVIEEERESATPESHDAAEFISIRPYLSEVTRSLEKVSSKLKMSRLNERKDYPVLEKGIIQSIERWSQIIRSIESRQVNDAELFRKKRLES